MGPHTSHSQIILLGPAAKGNHWLFSCQTFDYIELNLMQVILQSVNSKIELNLMQVIFQSVNSKIGLYWSHCLMHKWPLSKINKNGSMHGEPEITMNKKMNCFFIFWTWRSWFCAFIKSAVKLFLKEYALFGMSMAQNTSKEAGFLVRIFYVFLWRCSKLELRFTRKAGWIV